ncbi:IclR family transcriptional regulator [Streptomyces sp. NPDC088354]|uniref:IclR family transcriptional regulator n=1 Tax=unclassified Streptomyces TaxID=2593676 RepID=UPI0029AEFA6A|nr:IclR family transcriptional regulator C-terminal domain-containing protein [Streptomyces sp. MI02-7b]MDX3074136.1 IclR family transcriptional regulator C-terminal domain-containing protein [Streptomyces sp. MI02-7b]
MTAFETPAENVAAQVLQASSRILDCFSVETPHLHVSDIVRLADVPSSTVMELLPELADRHLLQRDGSFYSVGLRMIQWGASADGASGLLEAARSLLPALRDRTGECCGLQIRQDGHHVTLFWAHSLHALPCPGHVGRVQPLRGSAAGHVFMAHDLNALRIARGDGFASFPSSGVEPETPDGHLEQLRRRGWTFVDEGRSHGMSTLAAPVFAADGTVMAAVTLGGETRRWTTDRVDGLARRVVDSAIGMSRYLAACG